MTDVLNICVIACNNLARYGLAGVASLFASQIQTAIGNGILFTICGCLLLLVSINLVIVKRWGAQWRDSISSKE